MRPLLLEPEPWSALLKGALITDGMHSSFLHSPQLQWREGRVRHIHGGETRHTVMTPLILVYCRATSSKLWVQTLQLYLRPCTDWICYNTSTELKMIVFLVTCELCTEYPKYSYCHLIGDPTDRKAPHERPGIALATTEGDTFTTD